MTATESDSVDCEVRIGARPEIIFPFLTDPAKMVQWKGVSATLDPRPGGVYHVAVSGTDVVSGTYTEIEPNRRVVFTWGWEGDHTVAPPGSSTVEITLVPDGDVTIVHVRHWGLRGEARQAHLAGWQHFLPRLAVVAEGGQPGRDPSVTASPTSGE